MFDGLRYICFFDVTSNARKLLSVEVQNDYGDYSEIRYSRVQPVTRFSMQHTIFEFDVQRHLADSDGRPTACAQVLARVLKVPWHPHHSGPALHCRVPSRSEKCLLSKSDRYFFVVVDCDESYLLSVWSCCLVVLCGRSDSKHRFQMILIFRRKLCYGSKKWKWLILWMS